MWVWRHPRPQGAQGLCIGHTDLPMDPRRAKRLAHRIVRHARQHGLPRVVCTSPLVRCRLVGRILRRWGWHHVVDVALLETDFGAWEGRPWSAIPRAAIDAWCADLADHAPGGGSTLRSLLGRAGAWTPPHPDATVVAHAGWMLARRWVQDHGLTAPPATAADWPAAPAYGACWSLSSAASLASSSP